LRASPARREAETDARSSLLTMQTGSQAHFVMFYDAESFLIESVADFLAPTLRAGDRAIVIATPEHSRAIEAQLATVGFDVADPRNEGRYVVKDAARMLSRIMTGDAPDPARFRQV